MEAEAWEARAQMSLLSGPSVVTMKTNGCSSHWFPEKDEGRVEQRAKSLAEPKPVKINPPPGRFQTHEEDHPKSTELPGSLKQHWSLSVLVSCIFIFT